MKHKFIYVSPNEYLWYTTEFASNAWSTNPFVYHKTEFMTCNEFACYLWQNGKATARKQCNANERYRVCPKAATPKISPTRSGGFFVEVHLQEQSVPKKRLLPRLIHYHGDLFPIFCSVFVLLVWVDVVVCGCGDTYVVWVDVAVCGCGDVYVVWVDVVCGCGVADAAEDVDVDVSFCGLLTQPAINNTAITAAMMAT